MTLSDLFTRAKQSWPHETEAIEILETKFAAAHTSTATLLHACEKLKPEGSTLGVLELAAVLGEVFSAAKDTYQKSTSAGIVATLKPFHL